MVVLGGIKRIAKVSEIVVPFMAVLYVVLAVIIMVTNITAIPAAIVTIVKSAFYRKRTGRWCNGKYDRSNAERYCQRNLLE